LPGKTFAVEDAAGTTPTRRYAPDSELRAAVDMDRIVESGDVCASLDHG
jgi:hypothetical protein